MTLIWFPCETYGFGDLVPQYFESDEWFGTLPSLGIRGQTNRSVLHKMPAIGWLDGPWIPGLHKAGCNDPYHNFLDLKDLSKDQNDQTSRKCVLHHFVKRLSRNSVGQLDNGLDNLETKNSLSRLAPIFQQWKWNNLEYANININA